MNFNLGFKALAYPSSDSSDPISPCQCSLAFRCDDTAKEATLLLLAAVPTNHDTQTFVLQYDANKLLPSAAKLISGNNDIPRAQLDELLRNKDNRHLDIKTLALSVEQPCPLWCPDFGFFPHKPGSERSFRHFVELTKATTIQIVFDYKFLRKEHRGMFKAFSKAAKGLAGYPVEESLTALGLKKASWEVFGPVDAIGAPPAYDRSRKRSRRTASTSLSQSPNCFAPQSPTESYTSEKTVPLSPATADAIGRSLQKAPPVFDYQAEAINAAVSRQLPAYLDKALPTLLPDILQTLFTGGAPKPNISTSHDSSISTENSPPDISKLTPLGHSLLPHLRTHLVDQFQQYQTHQLARFEKTLDRLWDSAEGTRAHETAEMMEEMEEHKTDMMLLRNDAIDELHEDIGKVLAKGREDSLKLGDELTERLELTFGEICDKIEMLKRTQLKKMFAFEVRKYKRWRKGVPIGVGKNPIRGNQKLLGRKREAESVECVDC